MAAAILMAAILDLVAVLDFYKVKVFPYIEFSLVQGNNT